jgi:hypothetical protein
LDGGLDPILLLLVALDAPNASSNENAPGTVGETVLCVMGVNAFTVVLIALG